MTEQTMTVAEYLDDLFERDPFRHHCPNDGGNEINSHQFEFIDCQCFNNSRVAEEIRAKLRKSYAEFMEWEAGGLN